MTIIEYGDIGNILNVTQSSAKLSDYVNGNFIEYTGIQEGRELLTASFVFDGAIKTRPTQQTTLSNTPAHANGIDAIVLQHLPIPCTVAVASTVYEVDDGTLEISFDTPGEYPITITSFPHLDKTFTVEAI